MTTALFQNQMILVILGAFMLQSAFPRILCGVKDNDGKVPKRIQNLLLNLVKFNDNSMNAFVDSLYVSELVVSASYQYCQWMEEMTLKSTMILNLLEKYCPNF